MLFFVSAADLRPFISASPSLAWCHVVVFPEGPPPHSGESMTRRRILANRLRTGCIVLIRSSTAALAPVTRVTSKEKPCRVRLFCQSPWAAVLWPRWHQRRCLIARCPSLARRHVVDPVNGRFRCVSPLLLFFFFHTRFLLLVFFIAAFLFVWGRAKKES